MESGERLPVLATFTSTPFKFSVKESNIEANFPLQVILIYNQQGQVVMKVIAGQNQKIAIPLTQLAKGIYTMQVGKGDVKRFTIQ
jgi:hypothetical protein